ncbi:MAG: hypothetical protein EBQ52_05600 [Synechococcaceae bacterium LLD_019]|nr:hypothetical protein [Synechococcaceae bacterium LLD_019]
MQKEDCLIIVIIKVKWHMLHCLSKRSRLFGDTKKSDFAVLCLLWIFATAINFNKAFHIDDTVHIEIAKWIIINPLHPMLGAINWSQNSAPFYQLNQPHLYFYLLAVFGWLFGFSELTTHLFQSFFTFICIFLTYLIAKILLPKQALIATILSLTSSAFLVGQNLMVDVPLLAFWLGFFYVLISSRITNESKRFLIAGAIAGLACLVKYSSLPLIFILIVYLIISQRSKLLWTIFIPIGILLIWSLFNYLDYGAFHFLDRPINSFNFGKLATMFLSWLICLGSVIVYVPIFLFEISFKKRKLSVNFRNLTFLILMLCLVVLLFASTGLISEFLVEKFLKFLFLCNGSIIILLLAYYFVVNLRPLLNGSNQPILLCYLWFTLTAIFIIFFSPFMATRHILLVLIPVTLILFYYSKGNSFPLWRNIGLGLSVSLTFALGLSDRIWANFYREKAALIRRDLPKANIYFAGHWGWQWYAKKAGMIQLESFNPQVKPGDYLVYPHGIDQQRLDLIPFPLRLYSHYTDKPSIFTFFKTDQGRFYSSNWNVLPWTVNKRPFDQIDVYKVLGSHSSF